MIKIYQTKEEFTKTQHLEIPEMNGISEFSKETYIVTIVDANEFIVAVRNPKVSDYTTISGCPHLLKRLLEQISYLGLYINKVKINLESANEFKKFYLEEFNYTIKELDKNIFELMENNIKSCVLAGGCFWCSGKPYYEYDGIIHVYSGYSGGDEILPNYDEVKHQKTSHKESIKLIYDESKISYNEILDIYFETIDPFDDGGQFIDRGESYTTAIFYQNEEMKNKIKTYIERLQKDLPQSIVVKVLKEKVFYMAEEYHQDYALKNPEAMEQELIESGRIKK